MLLEVEGEPGLVVGSRVRVEVRDGGELGPAAVVFLLPVIGIIAGVALGSLVPALISRPTWGGTLCAVGGAAAGLCLSLVLIRMYDRRYRRRSAEGVRVSVIS